MGLVVTVWLVAAMVAAKLLPLLLLLGSDLIVDWMRQDFDLVLQKAHDIQKCGPVSSSLLYITSSVGTNALLSNALQ